MENAKNDNSALHLMGLLSNGGVHSHINHLKGLLKLAKEQEVKNVYVHCFMDGRDVPLVQEKTSLLNQKITWLNLEQVKLLLFQEDTMQWIEITDGKEQKLAYDAMVLGKGETATSAVECIEKSYADNKSDEFVIPCVIEENGAPTGTIKNGIQQYSLILDLIELEK